MKRVVIIGGGIAGLATAHALRDRAGRAGSEVDILVLEKSARPGGNIRTDRISGYLCEWGPNGFLDNVPETLELVRAIGLQDAVHVSNDAARKRFIFRDGRLHQLPEGVGSFFGSRLLSWPGKLRIGWEPFARRRPEGDETIHGFASRRIGREAADILIDSMVSGIFAGDSRELSLRACFPKMWQMETDHGGLFRAMFAIRRQKRQGRGVETLRPVDIARDAKRQEAPMGAPAGKLTSFHEGTETLIRGLVAALGGIVRTGARAVSVAETTGRAWQPAASGGHTTALDSAGPGGARFTPDSSGAAASQAGAGADAFRVTGRSPRYLVGVEGAGELEADAVVLAGPSPESASLVAALDPELAAELAAIPSAPIVVVCFGYDEAKLPRPLDGFGFLVPRGQGPRILGCLWDSSVYPGRAPRGKVLVRAMIGGARDAAAIELTDEEVVATVRRDLLATMGLDLAPEFVQLFRHPLGIPQYAVGHLDRLARIDDRLGRHPGIFLAGNAYKGISMNSCIAEAGPLAGRLLEHLGISGSAGDPVLG